MYVIHLRISIYVHIYISVYKYVHAHISIGVYYSIAHNAVLGGSLRSRQCAREQGSLFRPQTRGLIVSTQLVLGRYDRQPNIDYYRRACT